MGARVCCYALFHLLLLSCSLIAAVGNPNDYQPVPVTDVYDWESFCSSNPATLIVDDPISPQIDFSKVDQELIVRGQSEGESGGGDLAALAQNPVASLASVPLQSNWNFGIGAEERTQYSGLLQPVVPWKLSEDWNLITRMIVPFVNTPVGFDDNTHGLGDTQGQFFFSPNPKGKFIWGAGPMVIYPTASDPALGFGEWAAGFDAVALISTGKIVAGTLMTQAWGMTLIPLRFWCSHFLTTTFRRDTSSTSRVKQAPTGNCPETRVGCSHLARV
jgi:hypothetical protein